MTALKRNQRLRIAPILAACLIVLSGILPIYAQDATPQATSAAEAAPLYHDPDNRFTVEIPEGWTEVSGAEGKFENSSGVTADLLSVEATDVQAGIQAALAQAMPDVTSQPVQSTTIPAPNGIFTQNIYTGPYGYVAALAMVRDDRTYVEIFRAPDQQALQAASPDFNVFILGLTAGTPIDLTEQQPAALTPAQLDEFARYAQDQLKRYNVTGASVAIVQNGKVIFAQGFGTRTVGGEPVDADTLFMIGSTSKSMTTMMVGTLIDDGKLNWDTKTVDLLPSFALSDPTLTPQIRVRDLFSNASGVPRYDMPILLERQTPDQIIASLKSIPLVSAFGEKFNYSNQMVSTGGFVAAIAAGAKPENGGQDLLSTYESLMQKRVFDPIGMTRTTLDFDEAEADPNHATSYTRDAIEDAKVAVPPNIEKFAVTVAPAGAVWSSANDMARYLQTELAAGIAPDGTHVVSAENLSETQKPGVTVAGKLRYGMGWMIDDYHGLTLIQHGGNTAGYTSDFGFLPDANLGVLVLSNQGVANNYGGALREYVFEQAFGLEHTSEVYYQESEKALQSLGKELLTQFTLDKTAPASAQALLGQYEGNLSLVMDDSGKQMILRTSFADVPLYAVTNQDATYITTGAMGGIALKFDRDASGTTTMTAASAVNIGDTGLPKTYKKLS